MKGSISDKETENKFTIFIMLSDCNKVPLHGKNEYIVYTSRGKITARFFFFNFISQCQNLYNYRTQSRVSIFFCNLQFTKTEF